MGQIVKLRRSSISGQKPTNSNLQLGEIALNTTDGKAFMAVSGSLGESVQEFITTNTNNTGSINLVGNITASNVSSSFNGPLFTNYVDFNTSYTTSSVPGRFTWNPDEHTLNMGMGIGTATLQMGEELYYPLVINKTLETIYNGTVVMVDPSDPGQGDRVKIVKGDASGTYSSKLFLGILTEDITPGNLGLVTWFGKVRDLNVPSLESYGIKQVSDTWFEGALLYADPNHPGGLTTVEPIAPNLKIRLALVTRLNGNQVTIMVRPTLSPNLEEINNVRPDNVTHGDLLMRSGSVWENTKNLYGEYQITGSLGISGSQELRGDQIISGSVYITKDLVVLGTSSMQNVSASSVDIGTNIINLNTFAPGIRYGGVNVFDSGSSGLSGSLLWDSVTDNWIVIHQLSGGTVNSANLIYGPLSTGGLGTEVNLIENYITKVESGNHGHHITTSSIYDNGSKVAINSNTEITGSLTVTGGINGEINFDFITDKPTLVSGSSQVSYTGLSNIPVGIISGAAQLPAGTVSGSSQVKSFIDSATLVIKDNIIQLNEAVTALSNEIDDMNSGLIRSQSFSSMILLSQAEYDALAVKDDNTLYIILEG